MIFIHFVIIKILKSALVLSYDFAPCCKMFGITKQLLPGLLVDSADYHPSKELFPSRGDNLHYPPTSQAITVYYVQAII